MERKLKGRMICYLQSVVPSVVIIQNAYVWHISNKLDYALTQSHFSL